MANSTSYDLATEYTLPEVLRHKAPDGSYNPVIDVLSGKFPMIEEGYWVQANDDTSHEFIRMAYEPTGSLVRYNEGTAFESAVTTTIREQLARLESMLRIDTRVLEKAPDPVRYRHEMEAAHMRGMIKQWHKIVFGSRDSSSGPYYGDMGRDQKSINGLITRYNKLTTAASPVDNTRGLGASTSNKQSSLFLIKWGPQGIYFAYPRTVSRTLQVKDLKEQVVYDANSRPYTAVMTNFAWEFGLCVTDERAIQRLCNIGQTSDSATGSFGDDTDKEQGEKAMIDMIERLPNGDTSGCVFYAGPNLMANIRKRLNSKSNMFFTEQNVWGRNQLTFMDIPVVRCDALNVVEAVVS
jgi:hypothetical protein